MNKIQDKTKYKPYKKIRKLINHSHRRALKENGPNTLLIRGLPDEYARSSAEIVCRDIFLATGGVVAPFLVHFLGEQKMNIKKLILLTNS